MFGANKKALFYHQLATVLESGIGTSAALVMLQRQAKPAAARLVGTLQAGLSAGGGLGVAMTQTRGVAKMDASVMGAAERGGMLEVGARHLADYYQLVANLWREILAAMGYPMLVLHAAILLPGLVRVIGSSGTVFQSMVMPLLLAWLLLALLILAGKWLWQAGESQVVVDRILTRIPFLGSFRKSLAMARFCKVLEIHLRAGGLVSEAVKAAGSASGSALVASEGTRFAKIIAGQGCALGPLMVASSAFPWQLSQSLNTAETVGRLDEECGIRSQDMMVAAANSARGGGAWIPRFLYAPIAIFAIYQIFRLYSNYLAGAMGGDLDL